MRMRVFVALAAALLLLSSGLGSRARLFEEASFSPAAIVMGTGGLEVTAGEPAYRVMTRLDQDVRLSDQPACEAAPDFSTCGVLTKDEVEAFGFTRGDRLAITSTFAVAAEGENLRYAVAPEAEPDQVPAAWTAEPTAVSPAGPLTGSQTITAERVFDCVGAGADSAGAGAFAIPAMTVAAVQEDR